MMKKRGEGFQAVTLTPVGCTCALAGSLQEMKVLRQVEQMQAAHDLHEPL